MQVKYLLAAMTITIHHQPETVFGNAFIGGYFLRGQHHSADQFSLLGFDIVYRRNFHFGNDQNMHRRLWIDAITESSS
jgi:hypothetical protein